MLPLGKFTLIQVIYYLLLEHTCKETNSGSGYSGNLARSNSGRKCFHWSQLDSIIVNQLWKSQDLTIEDDSLAQLNNFCRNPDDDEMGPWCFTDKDTEKMEYCQISLCRKLIVSIFVVACSKFVSLMFILIIEINWPQITSQIIHGTCEQTLNL